MERIPPLLRSCIATSAVLGCAPQTLHAADWESSLALTSDYVHRGVSQTDGGPALQGSLAYRNAVGWYAGVWVSSVDTARRYYAPKGAQTEADFFVGFSKRVDADWTFDARVVRYAYFDDPAPVSYDYTEFTAGFAWRERLRTSIAVSPDSTSLGLNGGARQRFAFAGELSWRQPLTPWVSGLIGVGYQDLSESVGAGYYYGGANLTLQMGRFTLEAGHSLTSRAAKRIFGPDLTGSRTVVTASVSF